MKLSPSAQLLWEWILLQAPAGCSIDVRLKDFQSVTGEHRKKPYSLKQIRRAVGELESLGLVEIQEESVRMRARHPGPVFNPPSKSADKNVPPGTKMSQAGTKMSQLGTKMSQVGAETLTPQASQTPTDLFRSFKAAAEQDAAAENDFFKIGHGNISTGNVDQNTIVGHGRIETGDLGQGSAVGHGWIKAGDLNQGAAIGHGEIKTGDLSQDALVGHGDIMTGDLHENSVVGHGDIMTGDLHENSVVGHGDIMTGDLHENSVVGHGDIVTGKLNLEAQQLQTLKQLLGISRISYSLQCQLEAAGLEAVEAAIACFKEDKAEWKGEMKNPGGWLTKVLREVREGKRQPVAAVEPTLKLDSIQADLELWKRRWFCVPMLRSQIARDLEAAFPDGRIVVRDPEEGPVLA